MCLISKFNLSLHVSRRDEIMNVIKQAYIKLYNKNLPVYGVITKDLKDFTTTEKDMKKQVNRFPLESARIFSEDLLNTSQVEQVT